MPKRRIVLLCGEGYSSDVVHAALQETGAQVDVLLESALSRCAAVRRRIKRFGINIAVGQLAFRAVLVPLLQVSSRTRIRELRRDLPIPQPVASAPVLRVSSANETAVHRFLRERRPDLVVVNGTRILRPELLTATDAPFINLHLGITPLYRGVHGGYWALVEQRPDLFGATVHRIDEGVDTGTVLGRAFALPSEQDNFSSYPYLQLSVGLPVLARIARSELGLEQAVPVEHLDLPSRQRYHPTAWAYLKFRLTRGTK